MEVFLQSKPWEDFQNKGLYRFIEGQQLETFDYESGFWIQ